MTPKTDIDLDLLKKFGFVVRAARSNQGHSQEGFADLCGLDRAYVGGIERGERNLTLINIFKVLKALDLQPSVFFTNFDD